MGGVVLVERRGSVTLSYRGGAERRNDVICAASAAASGEDVTQCPGVVHPWSHPPQPPPPSRNDGVAECVSCACPTPAQDDRASGTIRARTDVSPLVMLAKARSAATSARRRADMPVL